MCSIEYEIKSSQQYSSQTPTLCSIGCNIRGLTSEMNLKKLEMLQKKCIRIRTFSNFGSHTNTLFIRLKS